MGGEKNPRSLRRGAVVSGRTRGARAAGRKGEPGRRDRTVRRTQVAVSNTGPWTTIRRS